MFYRPYITIILYVLNILPKKPFLSGFDFAKFVIVDSEKTKEVFLAHGAPDSKIKPFGYGLRYYQFKS